MDNGCYKLTWRERIGFCSGDVAQNIIYQTVSIWLPMKSMLKALNT